MRIKNLKFLLSSLLLILFFNLQVYSNNIVKNNISTINPTTNVYSLYFKTDTFENDIIIWESATSSSLSALYLYDSLDLINPIDSNSSVINDFWRKSITLNTNQLTQNKTYCIKLVLNSHQSSLFAIYSESNKAIKSFTNTCSPTSCNLIPNPYFQATGFTPSFGQITGGTNAALNWGIPFQNVPNVQNNIINCWVNGCTTPQIFPMNGVNLSVPPSVPNGSNAALMIYNQSFFVGGLSEGIMVRINQLQAGKSYIFSYYVKKFNNEINPNVSYNGNLPDNIKCRVHLLQHLLNPNGTKIYGIPTDNNIYPTLGFTSNTKNLKIDEQIVSNTSNWDRHVVCFTIPQYFVSNSYDLNYDYLFIAADYNTSNLNQGAFYFANPELMENNFVTNTTTSVLGCTNSTSLLDPGCVPSNSTFSWTGPNGFTSSTQTANVTQAGTYTFSYSILPSNANNAICGNTKTFVVSKAAQTNPFTFSTDYSSACGTSLTVNFQGAGGGFLPGLYSIVATATGGGITTTGFTLAGSSLSSSFTIPNPHVGSAVSISITVSAPQAYNCIFSSTLSLDPCCDINETNYTYNGCTSLISNKFTNVSTTWLKNNLTCGSNVLDGTLISSAGNARNQLVFNGILTVDCDFTFLNCYEIIFMRNATIIFDNNVTTPVKLTIDKSFLRACQNQNDFWTGIQLSNSKHRLILTQSMIQDAKIAIYADNDARVYLNQSVLNKNIYGLRLNDIRNYVSPYNTVCNAVTFASHNISFSAGNSPTLNTANATSFFNGQPIIHTPINNGKRAYTGILMYNCGTAAQPLNITSQTTNGTYTNYNQFNNLDYGIRVYGSFANIGYNFFSNINDNTTAMWSGSYPTAIDVGLVGSTTSNVNITSHLTPVSVNSFTDDNFFIDCKRAINVTNSTANIRNNKITKNPPITAAPFPLYGILVSGLNNKNVTIFDNTFYYIKNHIYLNNSNSASSLADIENNIIWGTVGNSGSNGIYAADITSNTTNKYKIANNTINNCTAGIYEVNINHNASNPYDNEISNNKILYTVNSSTGSIAYGIRLSGVKNATVKCNLVDNNASPNYFANNRGISIQNATNNIYFDGNTMHRCAQGLYVVGNCNPIYLLGNEFKDNMYGVLLSSGGEMGQQGGLINSFIPSKHWGNTFELPTWPNAKATYSSVSNLSNNSNFYVRATDIGNGPPYYGFVNTNCGQSGVSNLVTFSGSLTGSLSAPYVSNCSVTTEYARTKHDTIIPEHFIEVIEDTTYSSDIEGINLFMNQLAIYEELMDNSELRDNEGILQRFVDYPYFEAITKVYTMRKEVALAFDSSLLRLTDSMRIIIRNEHLQLAQHANTQIEASLASVMLMKQNYEVWLHALQIDSIQQLTEQEIQTVNGIAAMCLYTYGTPVLDARNMQQLWGIDTTYDDYAICYGNSRMADDEQSQIEQAIADANAYYATIQPTIATISLSNGLTLYPNPANDKITLSNSNLLTGKLNIYNHVGILLKTIMIDNKSEITIDLSMLHSGLYIYKLVEVNNKITEGKFSIVK